ncbi:phosphate propanoyltransferase [uncultured Cetobacterium sp.]|uniref:phosphate propanoyltransferase n=1 Tax=uncultured Cetobacterium sp. TaxID=527638 RepID=UPI00263165B3|nr:phosphate propanoyltransferase [uncultured Cetobacterium sp.]
MEIDEIVKIIKKQLLEECGKKERFPVEASGRHIHLSREDAEKIFGVGYEFQILKDLSQPGQYACKERVRVIGPKGIIEGVIVLGPFRDKTQIELSLTDTRILGVEAVLRESGDTQGTPGVYISNLDKMIKIDSGVIVAKNHIHMTEKDAEKLQLKDRQLVKVKINNTLRPIIFEDVIVRINNKFSLSMHLDYDEANACFLNRDSYGEIYE